MVGILEAHYDAGLIPGADAEGDGVFDPYERRGCHHPTDATRLFRQGTSIGLACQIHDRCQTVPWMVGLGEAGAGEGTPANC